MHIAIFLDHHVNTLGGIQSSVMLQKKYLERLGHRVTLCSPVPHQAVRDPWQVPLSSIRILGTEYRISFPTRELARQVIVAFDQLPRVDIVHIQADWWGAILGLAFAHHRRIPSIITFHGNVGIFVDQVIGKFFGTILVWCGSYSLFFRLGKRNLGKWSDPWNYLHNLATTADLVLAPTHHFARTLLHHGVADDIEIMPNGIDDELILEVERPANATPRFIWMGRMSPEKRLMEFLEAVHEANLPAEFHIYGDGTLERTAKKFVKENNLNHTVIFKGRVPHPEVLMALARADVFVQTSIGFEAHGMTVLEAAAVGTPSVLCDHLIAEDFPKSAYWLVADASVHALRDGLRGAYADIVSHAKARVSMDNEHDFRQSAMTAKVLGYYAAVLPPTALKQDLQPTQVKPRTLLSGRIR